MMVQEQYAVYKQSTDPMYRHNPYIEALPKPRNLEDVANLIRRHPVYSEQERELSALDRAEAVQRISNFMEPMPIHLELEQRFSRMIRNGYFARNPLQAQWLKQFRSAFPEADPRNFESDQPMVRSTAAGFAMIGTSGMGKSTAVDYILSLYTQVISHTEYDGQMFSQKQVVWLKLECPHDGSIKGLCKEFFIAIDKLLGTEYFKKFYKSRSTTDDLLPHMALLAARLGLGVLVIDEIQRLNEARSGGAALMLNFFV
ncbi:ATP-binding protein [Paenibacillus sp. MMS18-CY102]|uniref:ATP-binding protein n=1 Tax=Paenibacillus sp. MMS18-CY102 TaxID=2682849 RepID=UPI0013653C4B|nr:ATP-binding protein [Paenibacillus sp. MMS18-CY102]MWC27178.1 AAA family ATPase [Paenibacillus sp. MMS18-CY102]